MNVFYRTVATVLFVANPLFCGILSAQDRASDASDAPDGANVGANVDAAFESIELFGDLNFERGFEVVSGAKSFGVLRLPFASDETNSSELAPPTWKLATHGSKFDLTKNGMKINSADESRVTTPGQMVSRRRTADGQTILTLAVATDAEYDAPRTVDKLWIHLLLQRDFDLADRVAFGDVETLVFSVEARVAEAERLMTADEFDPGLHATQASVYFAISNDNPDSPDFRDFIWFGVSFFDDRTEIQSNYIEIDGDPKTIGTGKLIYRIGEQKTIDDVCGGVNPFSRNWTRVEIDLARYVGDMLTAAQKRGMLTQTTVDELKLSHFNFGWETPGTYRSALEIKNPRLVATKKR